MSRAFIATPGTLLGPAIRKALESLDYEIPEDAELVNAEWDAAREILTLVWQSDDFGDPEGAELPYLKRTLRSQANEAQRCGLDYFHDPHTWGGNAEEGPPIAAFYCDGQTGLVPSDLS